MRTPAMKYLSLQILFAINLIPCNGTNENYTKDGKPPRSVSIVDAFLTVPELISKYGYPVEVHNIITEDGYNLTVHRIPHGRYCKTAGTQRVTWLQHGLAASSADWVITGPNRDLGYYLADNCYDVWLGNSRGNRYSRKHIALDPDRDKSAFWSFSFNEFGLYDIPASIDYVLNITGASALYFVGHSLGATSLFVCLSEKPEYNAKIKVFSALAPGVFGLNIRSPIFQILAPFEDKIEKLLTGMNIYEMTASPQTGQLLGQTLCHQNSSTLKVCEQLLYEVTGSDPEQMDPTILSIAFGHYPGGNSVRTFTHALQLVNSRQFQKFDYRRAQNIQVYGKQNPPIYNFKNAVAPVAIYFGENDLLSGKADLQILARHLPNVKRFFPIKHTKYAHHDFLLAKDNLQLLNKPLLKFFKQF